MLAGRRRCGLAGFAAKVAEHGIAEEGVPTKRTGCTKHIGAGLVALALPAKPGDDVGVERNCNLIPGSICIYQLASKFVLIQPLIAWQCLGRGHAMSDNLKELLEKAKSVKVSPEQKEEQRRSFAYGNTNIENPRITRETVDQAAEQLKNR